MKVRLRLIFSIILYGIATYSLSSNPISGILYVHPQELQIRSGELESYLNNFAREIQDNHASDKCSEMFGRLVDYLEAESDICPADIAKISRYCGYYCYQNNLLENAKMYYSLAMETYSGSDSPDSIGMCRVSAALGLTYLGLGEYEESIKSLISTINLRKLYYGKESSQLISSYLNLSAAYLETLDFEKAREVSLAGIEIVNNTKQRFDIVGSLYYNLGVYYGTRSDYNNALSFYKVAETNQLKYDPENISMLLYIYNGFGVVYNRLNDTINAIDNYAKILDLVDKHSTTILGGSTYYSNYGHLLGKFDMDEKAFNIFNLALSYCLENYGADSKEYYKAMDDLGHYYYSYIDDYQSAYKIYNELMAKVNAENHGDDLIISVKTGMANVYLKMDEIDSALYLFSELLDSDGNLKSIDLLFLYSGRSDAYKAKYIAARSIEYIDAALDDLDMAIRILDSVKIDFTGESSRLQITGRFDFIWNDAIWLASEKYKFDYKKAYLNKAMRYSEKSKASTLLAATREVHAMEFHVPEDLVVMEKSLTHLVQEMSDKLNTLQSDAEPNLNQINTLEGKRMEAILARDSLIRLFEESYPSYYKLKHEDNVASCRDISGYLGRKSNFIEYFLSDSVLYTFVINRKGCNFITEPLDSNTRDIIREFRHDLINPAIETGARNQFQRIIKNGSYLNELLIEPLRSFLVSDRLIIATDDILSYIPFEALVGDTAGLKPLNYRDVNFLFKEFEIIYTYSGSLLLEGKGRGRSITNNTLIFAPRYTGLENSDSLLLSRQMELGYLNNIPGAKEEAIFISNLTGGKLYLDEQATEQKFVEEASGKNIIHLAMHTLLNDREPMLSKMIFTLNSDTIENGSLNTYEIYDLDLDSKMVVLSSCNTGSGYLQSGEGVISLARGFMYAGTPAVVMSLWEVDDYSASQIVKLFYKNLKSGSSKSDALKRSRRQYLKTADQMRSHPYFWCTLVILGEDEPIYYNKLRVFLIVLLLISIVYVLRRYYRPKSS